eukprot:2890737-Rhodomonas_salina.1
MSGTDLVHARCAVLSAYAHGRRCPVLTERGTEITCGEEAHAVPGTERTCEGVSHHPHHARAHERGLPPFMLALPPLVIVLHPFMAVLLPFSPARMQCSQRGCSAATHVRITAIYGGSAAHSAHKAVIYGGNTAVNSAQHSR